MALAKRIRIANDQLQIKALQIADHMDLKFKTTGKDMKLEIAWQV